MKLQYAVFCLLSLTASVDALAQTSGGSAIQASLDRYSAKRMQEKCYLHTDKDSYLSGELCWFKLYVVDAAGHRPLDLSKVAYLEWLDKNNKPVLQTKIGLDKGHGHGSVFLPHNLPSGNYKLRAYTSWMKNDGEDWFFEKHIMVVNAQASAGIPLSQVPLKYELAFFPEGGDLVENLAGKIAFRLSDQYGRGVQCVGVVTDNDRDTIVRIDRQKFGIGNFTLTPQTGHHYRMIARLADGTAINQLLPQPQKSGVVMTVTQINGDKEHVTLQSTDPSAALTLIAHTRRSVKFIWSRTLQSGRAEFDIDRSLLGDGISHLTVFNADRQPVCERLVFKYPSASPRWTVGTDKDSYTTRQKINLRIEASAQSPVSSTTNRSSVPSASVQSPGPSASPQSPVPSTATQSPSSSTGDQQSATAPQSLQPPYSSHHIFPSIPAQPTDSSSADYSISVFRLDSLQGLPDLDIASYIYLTSDLRGRIESPGYYFQHPEDTEAIDNLMLSHGWRRFRWDDILHDREPFRKYPPEFNGSIITGSVVDTRTGKPVPEIQSYLSVPGTRTQFATASSNEEGVVKFEMKDFYGSQEIIVQTNSIKDSFYRIDVENPFLERYTPATMAAVPLTWPAAGYASALMDKSIAVQATNKYYAARLRQFKFPAIDTSAFYYKGDFSYLLDDYTRFTTMEEVLREYVKLMLVERRHGGWRLPMYDLSAGVSMDLDPLVLVDAVPVFDFNKLMAMDPLKIRKLDMVHRKFFYGDDYFHGIMNWITYKGDLGGYTLDSHATVVDYEGLELEREFYSPSYDQGQSPEAHLPDFRNVLYWSPSVPVDSRGKGALSFYTSDIPGKYVVVMEGLTPTGSAGTAVTTFEVR